MQTIDVGLKGVLHGVAAALPLFQEQGSGHFIHTASTAARKVVQGQAVYAGTKAAVLAIADGLRQELAGRVRVTVILPGYTTRISPATSGTRNSERKWSIHENSLPCRLMQWRALWRTRLMNPTM